MGVLSHFSGAGTAPGTLRARAGRPAVSAETRLLKRGENHVLSIASPSGVPKPEEGPAAVSVTGNDITAPPNKELPPSPEKKAKVVARMVGSSYAVLCAVLPLVSLES